MSASERGSSLRVVVLGYVVRGAMGGMAWHYLQYILGLSRMGHDVFYVEDSGDEAWSCYDPERDVTDANPTYGLRFMDTAARYLGLGDRWAYFDAHQQRWRGPGGRVALAVCAQADLVLNVSGANPLRSWFDGVEKRVFVDTDPAFTQVRNLVDPEFRARTSLHNVFVSFGENIGANVCRIPDDGFPWLATRQPVVLDAWPVGARPDIGGFTSVMQWRTKNAQEHSGVRYGTKEDSFEPFFDLPRAVEPRMELAVGGKEAPRRHLQRHGWRVVDPRFVASDLEAYRRYIQMSTAEFSVAKHGYVVSHSGWFSERSACYLASGRPVVGQDTGFTSWLPTGRGLLAFATREEAQEAIGEVCATYDLHSAAAREIASSSFDHEDVLTRLIEHVYDGSLSGHGGPAASPRSRSTTQPT